jgi:hypothetical protein
LQVGFGVSALKELCLSMDGLSRAQPLHAEDARDLLYLIGHAGTVGELQQFRFIRLDDDPPDRIRVTMASVTVVLRPILKSTSSQALESSGAAIIEDVLADGTPFARVAC